MQRSAELLINYDWLGPSHFAAIGVQIHGLRKDVGHCEVALSTPYREFRAEATVYTIFMLPLRKFQLTCGGLMFRAAN